MLVREGARGTRISALSPEADRLGLLVDMTLADARAMVPGLQVVAHDEAADAGALEQLTLSMMRYSPCVARHESGGLVLETTGCDHLHGGEAAMAADMVRRLGQSGLTARVGIANTFAAAFALAHYGAEEVSVLPGDASDDALDDLPVEALRLDGETCLLLRRLGLKTVGAVRGVPRQALECRFREIKKRAGGLSRSVQLRLDQLLGVRAEPVSWAVEPARFRVEKPCPALALEAGAVEIALEELLPRLCEALRSGGQGAREVRLTGYRAEGGAGTARVRLSQPCADPARIKRLFRDRLDRIDCGFGIDLFVLEAGVTARLDPRQGAFMPDDGMAGTHPALAGFSDTIRNRLGPEAVWVLAPRQSHVPERVNRRAPAGMAADWAEWKEVAPVWAPRPLRLFERPEPAKATAELPDSPPAQFVWRRRVRRVVRSRGPERILPEWWRDDFKGVPGADCRDYYDVEDEDGVRYWLFRAAYSPLVEGTGEGDVPVRRVRLFRWFVHGLF